MKKLPILSSMRVTMHAIPSVKTPFGLVTAPVYECLQQMDEFRRAAVLTEVTTIKQLLENWSAQDILAFNEAAVPDWILKLLDAPVEEVISTVPKQELHHLKTTLVGTITEVKNGKVVWSFCSNPKKTGYAHAQGQVPITVGEHWLLMDTGAPKVHNKLVAGVRLTEAQAKSLARALSAAWHMVKE